MANVPLTWQLQIQGAEVVKSKLSEVNAEFERGEISTEEYAKKLRGVNRDARTFTQSMNMQKNIFLATHPVLNNLSRAMSVFGGVMRAVQSTINTILLAQTAFNTGNANTMRLLAEAEQKEREYNKAVADFGEDSQQAIKALQDWNIAIAEANESVSQDNRTKWLEFFGIFAGAIIIFQGITDAIPNVKQFVKWIVKILKALGLPAVLTGSAALKGLFEVLGKIAIPVAVVEFFSMMGSQLAGDGEIRQGLAALIEIFTVDLPAALALVPGFFINIWNLVITATNGFVNKIITGVETLINSFIKAVNVMISAYNSAAPKFGLPTIALLQPVALERLALETIPTGVTGPAPGAISGGSLAPPPLTFPKSGAQGGSIVQQITVQGSIVSENDIKKLWDKWLKEQLISTGFR